MLETGVGARDGVVSDLDEIRQEAERRAEEEQVQYAPDDKVPLTPAKTQVSRRLMREPEAPDILVLFKERPFLTRGIVGEIAAAGGTGKGFFLLGLAYHMAGNQRYGPLKPARPLSILCLFAEDPPAELDRRLWGVGSGNYPSGLYAISMAGVIGPLMYLKGNEPKRSHWWQWLRDTVANHDIDLLILDPKSRVYGLDENNADHATQWIASLEALAVEFNITILFAHHVSKASSDKSLSQHMSRGSSAIADGCRWMLGMEQMNPATANRYGINNPKQYICVDLVKSNYAAQLSAPMYFKRDAGGVLVYAALEADRLENMATELVEAMRQHDESFSRRELRQDKRAKPVVDALKEVYGKFDRHRELDALVDYALDKGWLVEKHFGRQVKLEVQGADVFDFNQK
jgi:replicative DNA helicase